MQFIGVVPAYGRDYKSQREVKADWDAGKDFRCTDIGRSGYVSKADAPTGATITVRYGHGLKVMTIRT